MGRKWVIARPQVALPVTNGLLMRDAAVAGLGVALLATFLLEIPRKKRTLKVLDIGLRQKEQRSISLTRSICARPGKFAPSRMAPAVRRPSLLGRRL